MHCLAGLHLYLAQNEGESLVWARLLRIRAHAPRLSAAHAVAETNGINTIEHKSRCSCCCMTRALTLFALLLATAAMSAVFAQQQQVQA